MNENAEDTVEFWQEIESDAQKALTERKNSEADTTVLKTLINAAQTAQKRLENASNDSQNPEPAI